MGTALQEGLVVTHWFDPAPYPTVHSVTVRFIGSRMGVMGKPQPGDRFVHDETIQGVLADGGPVSVTARVRGVNPGKWMVTSEMRPTRHERRLRRQARAIPAPRPLYPAAWSWHRWALSRAPKMPVQTGLIALAFMRTPAVVPGVWIALAALGVIIGVVLQALLISRAGLEIGQVLALSVIAVLTGFVGAKVWFMVLHRRDHRFEGWCIQGFLTGFLLAVAAGLVVVHVPVGLFLDASAPGLFLGLAVGRLGCFFAGCCYGRPTASRWGVWSSDQRIGVRRIPTQLIESGLALAVGLAALVAVLTFGPLKGGVMVAGLAVYTLCRQGILRLRGERRQSTLGGPLVAAAAALVLAADGALLALRAPWLP